MLQAYNAAPGWRGTLGDVSAGSDQIGLGAGQVRATSGR